MASDGDILRLIFKSRLADQQVINVYHYLVDGIIGSGNTEFINGALSSAFGASIRPLLQDVQNQNLTWESIEVINLNDVLGDFFTVLVDQPTVVGDFASNLLTWSIQLKPVSKLVRSGRKAIAGVSEGELDGNEPSSTALPKLVSLAGAMAQTLTHSNADFTPVIARIAPASVRPFVPFAVPVLQGIVRGVGTQYSRRVGRGA